MNLSEAPYQFESSDTYSVLVLYPLINDGQWGNVSQLGTEILARLETLKSPVLIVDLSPLDYMGSAQVALLVRVWKSLKKVHGRMVVQCPGQMVREVLAIAGLKSLWDIVETREAALMSLGLRSKGVSSGRPSMAGPLVAITALLGAGIAMGLTLNSMLPNVDPTMVLLIELGFIIAAIVAGAMTAVMQRGLWRGVGTAVVIASVIMTAISIVQLNRNRSGAATNIQAPPATSSSSGDAAKTETVKTETKSPPSPAPASSKAPKPGSRAGFKSLEQ